jgi:hypothetical protein
MKVELVHKFSKFDLPLFEVFDIIAVELFRFELVTHKFYTVGDSENFLLPLGFGAHYMKNCFESDKESFTGLTVFREMIEDAFRS